jgi:hypothetical protein
MLGGPDVSRYAEGALLNTDDRLPLEFSAPRALYRHTRVPNWKLMTNARFTFESALHFLWPTRQSSGTRALHSGSCISTDHNEGTQLGRL